MITLVELKDLADKIEVDVRSLHLFKDLSEDKIKPYLIDFDMVTKYLSMYNFIQDNIKLDSIKESVEYLADLNISELVQRMNKGPDDSDSEVGKRYYSILCDFRNQLQCMLLKAYMDTVPDKEIFTSVGIYRNYNYYKSNGVHRKDLHTHLLYNLWMRPGRLFMIDFMIFNSGYLGIKGFNDCEWEFKVTIGGIKHDKCTMPYQ
ncbi:hypothetical protein YerA41_078 [Yersinia phage YerA41]|nr:hypothetical protein YerA41_078 [Yersinia phage YerA41]